MDDVIAATRKNVLVTGGAGFVGSRIVAQLLDAGANVRVLVDLSTGLRTNLPDGRPIDVVEGTVQSFDAVREAMTDQDIVIHAAARNIVLSTRHPRAAFDVNIGGTLNVVLEGWEALKPSA
jgi:UDP-glucose 4-epimerase